MFNNKVNDSFFFMNPLGAQDSPEGACLDVVLAKLLGVLKQNCLLCLNLIRFTHVLTQKCGPEVSEFHFELVYTMLERFWTMFWMRKRKSIYFLRKFINCYEFSHFF